MTEQQIGELAAWWAGAGAPVVFVHGNGSTHETWHGVVHHLSDQFRCITYDLRGHGRSPLTFDSVSFDTFVDDLEELRSALALDRMTLVGHSLGAVIAAAYARRFPARLHALAILAAPARRTAEDRRASEALIQSLKRDGLGPTMSTLIKSWYTDDFVAAHPDLLAARLRQLEDIDETVFIETYEIYSRTDLDPWLKEIAIPTLVLTGEFARGCGAAVAEYIAAQLAAARPVVIRGLKNGILTEEPDRVAEHIAAFLATLR
jgi:3-oxoadipate enol-lactonase